MAAMADHARLRRSLHLLAAGLAAVLSCGHARAQEPATKIWDVKLGTPVAALPLDQFVDPACGTNGGPPPPGPPHFPGLARPPPAQAPGLPESCVCYEPVMAYV